MSADTALTLPRTPQEIRDLATMRELAIESVKTSALDAKVVDLTEREPAHN
jgi:hypothetical protein